MISNTVPANSYIIVRGTEKIDCWIEPEKCQRLRRKAYINTLVNHTPLNKCPDCGGLVISDMDERFCTDCGLVVQASQDWVAGFKICLPLGKR